MTNELKQNEEKQKKLDIQLEKMVKLTKTKEKKKK